MVGPWVVPLVAALSSSDRAFLKAAEPPRQAWSYAQHGADWPGACAEQSGQSPIELPALAAVPNASVPNFYYRFPIGGYMEPVTLYNDGMLISATFGHDKKLGGIGIGPSFQQIDKSWSLQEMTLHAPSEHTWGGTHLPAELQLVHSGEKPEDGLAVVVVGLARGSVQTSSVFWDTLIGSGLPEEQLDEKTVNVEYPETLDFTTVVGNRLGLKDTGSGPSIDDPEAYPEYFMYEGSVTVPPCTPGVTYFVRAEPLHVNPERIESLVSVIRRSVGQSDGNYRITQPLAGRPVTKLKAANAEAMESKEEILAKNPVPTTSPVVNITRDHGSWDPSGEDAVAETEATKLSAHYSDPTEFDTEERKARAATPDSVVAAFDHTKIMEDPESIADGLGMVTDVQAKVSEQSSAVTAASLEEQQALAELAAAQMVRTHSEGYDNMTVAESQLLTAQGAADQKRMVKDAQQKKLDLLKTELGEAKAEAQSVLWAAQQQVTALNNATLQAEQGGGGSQGLDLHFTLPTGSAADPFSRHNAETVSRITKQPLPQHLTPGLAPNHFAVWGTVPVKPVGSDDSIEVDEAGGSGEATTSGGIVEQPSPTVETMTVTA